MPNIAIGRQPIFDRDLQTVAYELLFRDASEDNSANIKDADLATTQVIINAVTEIGLKKLVDNHPAFINLTQTFLQGDLPMPKMDRHFVLEILEDIPVTEKTLAGAKRLQEQGYVLALDDFIYHPQLDPFVDLASIIKLDILQMDEAQISASARQFKQRGKKILAEKVETHEQFELCRSLKFDYYQGYFFCKPEIISQKVMPAAKIQIMKVLVKLHNPDIGVDELSEDISKDVTLSYRLLRYLNSAHFSLHQEVDSIRQAIMMLGWNNIKNIATLIVMSRIDDKPPDLLKTGLVRARMCFLLADKIHGANKDTYFTAGLFSIIDALMDTPIEDIIQRLPLAKELQQALVDKQGDMGTVLASVIDFVAGRHSAGTEPERLNRAYLDALTWADSAMQELHAITA